MIRYFVVLVPVLVIFLGGCGFADRLSQTYVEDQSDNRFVVRGLVNPLVGLDRKETENLSFLRAALTAKELGYKRFYVVNYHVGSVPGGVAQVITYKQKKFSISATVKPRTQELLKFEVVALEDGVSPPSGEHVFHVDDAIEKFESLR